MTTMPDSYYDNFDASRNYEKILYRDGYTLQGAELNEEQSASIYRLKSLADALFKDGDIIRDAGIVVDRATGKVTAQSGAVYLRGAVRGVPEATFTIPVEGTVAVGIRLTERVISELDDPRLYNPAVGSRGEGEPGAWRLQVNAEWGFDGDGKDGEFYVVYTVDNGELRAKEAPPTLDTFTQSIARYDRDSTAGGSYIVEGLNVLMAADEGKNQVYTVSEGRARVSGYGVDLPTSRRLTYPAVPDLRRIDTEVHTADTTSTRPGGQRITVSHPPLHSVESVRITTRKTVSLVHGSYSGAADSLPDTSVVSIVECRQDETVYVAGADYKKTGDTVDWSPSGNEPATGSTYTCTYDCIIGAEPQKQDADGFSVEGAVDASSILITYRQALPRLDRLAITQDGQFLWLQGVASESNPLSPTVPSSLLPIATVSQTWRETRSVRTDGVRVVPFSEITAINRRIEAIQQEVARQRLESDVFTRESGARAGIFVDPLLNDDMRDQGLSQTAAVVNGVLTLPITASASGMPNDVETPAAMQMTPVPLLSQPLRTGEMKVNPYQAFDPLPARLTLNPALDRWVETRTDWTSDVTRKFDVTRDGYFHVVVDTQTSTGTELAGSTTTELEYLREIDVAWHIEGFGAGEELASATFDGIALDVSGTADGSGALDGSFRIPAGVPAGAKTVTFTGRGGTRASGVFVGQGQLTVNTMRKVNTITTIWVDPLAQTFVPDRAVQLAGVDLWFTAKGGDARLQIREVDNGVPTRTVLAEAHIPASSIVVSGGGHTRVLLPSPLPLEANTEYALVVMCDDAETALSVAELGKFDAVVQQWVVSQPYQVGVLLSSSNASTWTAHQDRDLTFRLLEASYTEEKREIDLGSVTVSEATDILLLSLSEIPSAEARIEYDMTLPGGETLTVADGQPLRLNAAATGQVNVRARMTGTASAGPVLWPGTQLVSGKVSTTADYATRSIPARGATRAVLVYDAVIPSGASVTPELKKDSGGWETLTADGTTNQGDGLVEYRWKAELSGVSEIKARLTLTGTATARPRVSDIRLMAVI